MAKRALQYLGHPALRRPSNKILDVGASSIQHLLSNMENELRAEAGVGIAAPQLGVNKACFLMLHPDYADEMNAENFQFNYILNPKIIKYSQDKAKDFEGCLSIPHYRGVVERSIEIDVEYQDRNGNLVKETLFDYPARIFQHEFDHLKGILFIDRMENLNTFIHNDMARELPIEELQKLLL